MMKSANRSRITRDLLGNLYPGHKAVQFSRTRQVVQDANQHPVFWALSTVDSLCSRVTSGAHPGREGTYRFSSCFQQLMELEMHLGTCRVAFTLVGGSGLSIVEVEASQFFQGALDHMGRESFSFFIRRGRGARNFNLFFGEGSRPIPCSVVLPWTRIRELARPGGHAGAGLPLPTTVGGAIQPPMGLAM